MKSPGRTPLIVTLNDMAAQIACGAVLGCIAAVWVGAGFAAPFGLFFGAIVGLFLSPIAIALFRPAQRARAVGVAMVCGTIGILLSPTPRLLGPTFVNAVAGWIGSLVIMRITMGSALSSNIASRFAISAIVLAVVAAGVFGTLHIVRSWPEAQDPTSALAVVNKAFRSNAMEVHSLGHHAFLMLSEAEAEGLSRDADDRVRYHVARALTGAQSDEFARTTLDRLATDADWLTRLEAYWSMSRRWPQENDAIAARMRADAHPNIRESAGRVAR
jgi:hypothetical protein